jgi:hypothetical protein
MTRPRSILLRATGPAEQIEGRGPRIALQPAHYGVMILGIGVPALGASLNRCPLTVGSASGSWLAHPPGGRLARRRPRGRRDRESEKAGDVAEGDTVSRR